MNKPLKRGQTVKSTPSDKHRALRGGWQEQWRYALRGSLADMWCQPLATLLTVMVIAISLTLPCICYMGWKNVSQAAEQWYPAPQLTVFFSKTLDDHAAEKVITRLKEDDTIDKVNYLSREEAITEFRNWSGFGGALDLLEQNPLPAVAIITPKLDFQDTTSLHNLRSRVASEEGIDDVRMDDSWFARLAALTGLIGKVTSIIGLLMVIAVLLVTGNSVRSRIFARRDTINVQKLLGATDGFILRPFLYGGAMLSFSGAVLSLILTQVLVWRLEVIVTQVAAIFGTIFRLNGLSWDESVLLLVISAMIGWMAAWLATAHHLRQFKPQ